MWVVDTHFILILFLARHGHKVIFIFFLRVKVAVMHVEHTRFLDLCCNRGCRSIQAAGTYTKGVREDAF